jgi:RimJ/RimL family protein N-acetyltransferase
MDQQAHIPVLLTARLRLRSFRLEDLAALAPIYADPEVMRYIRDGTRTEIQTAAAIDAYIAEWSQYGYGVWAVADRQNSLLLGMCGFVERAELGYIFGRTSWGCGFATEAADASLWYGFERLGFDSIGAGALCDNAASRHVMAKLGMRQTANAFFDSHGGVYYRLECKDYRPLGTTMSALEQ